MPEILTSTPSKILKEYRNGIVYTYTKEKDGDPWKMQNMTYLHNADRDERMEMEARHMAEIASFL